MNEFKDNVIQFRCYPDVCPRCGMRRDDLDVPRSERQETCWQCIIEEWEEFCRQHFGEQVPK